MKLFKLEEYLGRYEFVAPHLLCCSDAESWTIRDLLEMGAEKDKTDFLDLPLSYTELKGNPVLRKLIAESFYPGLSPDHILITAGAEDGIFCTLTTLLNAGDHCIVLVPCYQSLYEVPYEKGVDITSIPLREENQWKIDVEEIKSSIRGNTKALIMNFPHNPTGQVITQEELKELTDLCATHNIWLFNDEVYRLLGNPTQGWADPVVSLYSKGISLGVMSKAFGLPGLRIGWIACQDKKLVQDVERMKHYTSLCNSAPSEYLACLALKNASTLLERNNTITQRNLDELDRFFQEYRDLFSWVRPQGGCIGYVRYHGNETTDDFCHQLVQEQGVLLLPGSIYNHSKKYFRIGFGRLNMSEALNQFKMFLKKTR